jgi:acyl carrier protein
MSSSSAVDNRVREIVAEVLDLDPESMWDGMTREEVGAWDSMTHLRLVSALEEAFGIRFTMKEVGEMESFDAVRRKVAERALPG